MESQNRNNEVQKENLTIKNFISKFHNTPSDNVTVTFTNGCCYWFANILCERFSGEIMYDPIENHFVAGLNDRLFDITGDVTDVYNVVKWSEFTGDPVWRERLYRQCVLLE